MRQLAGLGVSSRDAAGKYGLGEAVAAYIAFKVQSVSGDSADWNLRRLRAAALPAELELDRAQQVAADPMAIWPRVRTVCNAHITHAWSLLNTLPPRLAGMETWQEVHTAIELGLRPLRDRLAAEVNAEAPELGEVSGR